MHLYVLHLNPKPALINSFAGEANCGIVRFRVASNYANVTRKRAFPPNNYCIVGYTVVLVV